MGKGVMGNSFFMVGLWVLVYLLNIGKIYLISKTLALKNTERRLINAGEALSGPAMGERV